MCLRGSTQIGRSPCLDVESAGDLCLSVNKQHDLNLEHVLCLDVKAAVRTQVRCPLWTCPAPLNTMFASVLPSVNVL